MAAPSHPGPRGLAEAGVPRPACAATPWRRPSAWAAVMSPSACIRAMRDSASTTHLLHQTRRLFGLHALPFDLIEETRGGLLVLVAQRLQPFDQGVQPLPQR